MNRLIKESTRPIFSKNGQNVFMNKILKEKRKNYLLFKKQNQGLVRNTSPTSTKVKYLRRTFCMNVRMEVTYVIDLSILWYDGPNDIYVTLQVALYIAFFSMYFLRRQTDYKQGVDKLMKTEDETIIKDKRQPWSCHNTALISTLCSFLLSLC